MATEKETQALVGRIRQLEGVIKWALGESGNWPERKDGEGPYYWRHELRLMTRVEPVIFEQQLILETSLQKRLANAVNILLQAKIKTIRNKKKRNNWVGQLWARSSDFSDTKFKCIFQQLNLSSESAAREACHKARRDLIYREIMEELTIDWAFTKREDG